MTPPPRVVVIGDLEATRLLCTLLTEEGAETVHLLAPDEPALRTAFARHVAGVAVVVRGDVVALRYALLAENLQPAVPMVVSVFDRTIGRQLASVVPNCTVTSPADVAAPSVVAACVRPDALAVLAGGPSPGPSSTATGSPSREPWAPAAIRPEGAAVPVDAHTGTAARTACSSPACSGWPRSSRSSGRSPSWCSTRHPRRLLRVHPARGDGRSRGRAVPRRARVVPRRVGAAHAHRHRLHRRPRGRASSSGSSAPGPPRSSGRAASLARPRGDLRAGAGRPARRSAAARAAGAVRGRRADRRGREPPAGTLEPAARRHRRRGRPGGARASRAAAAHGPWPRWGPTTSTTSRSSSAPWPWRPACRRSCEPARTRPSRRPRRCSGSAASPTSRRLTAAWVCASVRGQHPVVAYAHAGLVGVLTDHGDRRRATPTRCRCDLIPPGV